MPRAGKAAPGEVRQAVHVALQAGYRHIDCASVCERMNGNEAAAERL